MDHRPNAVHSPQTRQLHFPRFLLQDSLGVMKRDLTGFADQRGILELIASNLTVQAFQAVQETAVSKPTSQQNSMLTACPKQLHAEDFSP